MSDYLETIYFRNETGDNDYPQKLCSYIAETYLALSGDLHGKTLLDIGSGKGNHLIGFQRHGINVTGIDKRDECINALSDIEVKGCNIEEESFPFKENCFDFVYSKSVLEHVLNTDNFLSEALRVLKPGGVAVFLTPDWKSQCKYFWDDYTHVKAFTRKSLQNAMILNGFENVDCSYFLQLPFLWKYPWMKIFTSIIALLPDFLKWKDKAESKFRPLIRFSKEEMLLAVGYKSV